MDTSSLANTSKLLMFFIISTCFKIPLYAQHERSGQYVDIVYHPGEDVNCLCRELYKYTLHDNLTCDIWYSCKTDTITNYNFVVISF